MIKASIIGSATAAGIAAVVAVGLAPAAPPSAPKLDDAHAETVRFNGEWRRDWTLDAGQAIEVGVRVAQPGKLPPNGRVEVRWRGPAVPFSDFKGPRGDLEQRASADWSKRLHELDPDVYLVYRTPVAGVYSLELWSSSDLAPELTEIHRDSGLAPRATPPPASTPPVRDLDVTVELTPVAELASGEILIEAEPNNTPEQAIEIPFAAGDAEQKLWVLGGADELEYFDNVRSGRSPDDWYKIVYRGSKTKILTANLQMVEPVVSARIRVYKPGAPTEDELNPKEPPKHAQFGNANPVPYLHPPAEILPGPEPIHTYYDGRDINERIHQQDDNFRSFVTRRVHPGGTYYLRVEANQPGYELELRLLDPAPFSDPRRAVERSIDYHLAEIDAWLIHRPRNIAVHRRVRDGSSLFGENCMSCHTQSGVWGVAEAFGRGYRAPDRTRNHRRLVNTMYESLRPSIKLEDAAVNTSLAPNDLGDAPAGSRVAGRNIVLHERTFRPKKLHAHQQRRTANYVLQTADPQGINAAGKGSNFGPVVVFKFAAEILERAWRDTGEERYFRGLEEKARKAVEVADAQLKVVDDLGHRIEFFHEIFPQRAEYLETVAKLSGGDAQAVDEARAFYDEFEARAKLDLARLLALQQENGGWGFDLGVADKDGWTRLEETPDAAPTAVALIALRAAGYGPEEEPARRAVQWLLANQFDYGLWNEAAQTGFVTNAYVIRALSGLFPGEARPWERSRFEPRPNETPLEKIARVRELQTTNRADFADLMIAAARDSLPIARYYAYLGLGGALSADGVPTLIDGLDDPVKMCREAAFWSLRQLLLDDQGWAEAFAAYRDGSERTRQSVMQALVSRADLEGSGASVDRDEFAELLATAMEDPFAGVRAFAQKAAWRWWVWNPSMRDRVNRAWVDRLTRAEPNALAAAALRYSTASVLMVNGQIANQTGGDNIDQQYPELADLYRLIGERRESAPAEERRRLDRRLTAVAATHFQERGNDGGPGQMGYSTPGGSRVMGEAVLAVYRTESDDGRIPWRRIALEGAANINHEELQRTLLDLLQTGDLEMVAVAARALSSPQALSLQAAPETLRPMLAKVDEFLRLDRKPDAEALVNFLSKVRWDFEGVSEEQERAFYRLLTGGDRDRAAVEGNRAAADLLGRPAPATTPAADPEVRAALLGQVLGDNRSLRRKSAFEYVGEGGAVFWLPSTEWMAAYEEGGLLSQEAVEGAVEAEDLEVVELTFGRTTQQIVPDGLTSRNTILWWREGVPGARLVFALDAPEAGSYELISAFLYDREMGIARFELNGREIGEPRDFYKPDLSASGPVSLGVHEFVRGRNLFAVQLVGGNPDAEPNHVFGIDYVKLAPDEGSGSIFSKNDQGVEVIDPVVIAKEEVVRMFTRWFDRSTPEEVRARAINLAGKTALRRNPEVRKALGAYVEQEPIPELRRRIQNILDSDDEVYGGRLRKLIDEQAATLKGTDVRRLESSDEWIEDLLRFRDSVFVEMTKINPTDNRACISCHGVPGRVPTLFLHPPDAAGYLPPEELLTNYRRLQQRVDLVDVEKSKLLLKPLNIQTGEDDGHQGGVRYQPEDAGYRIIRDWVARQATLQRP